MSLAGEEDQRETLMSALFVWVEDGVRGHWLESGM